MPPQSPILQAAARHPILIAVGACGVIQVIFPGAIYHLIPDKVRAALLDIPIPKQLRPLGMAFVDFAPRLRSLFKIKTASGETSPDPEEEERKEIILTKAAGEEEENEVVEDAPAAERIQVDDGGGVPIDGSDHEHQHHEEHHHQQHHEEHHHHHHEG